MLVPGEEIYALFGAFIAITLVILPAVWTTQAIETTGIEMKVSAASDGLADLLAKKCVTQNGSFDLERLGNMTLANNTEVKIAGRRFGATPPTNASVYLSKRVVFVNSSRATLEVRTWK